MARARNKFYLVAICYLYSLQLSSCQFANDIEQDFTFQCPGQQGINGIFSVFSEERQDRLWSYSCGGGQLINVSSTCRTEETLTGSIDFSCPDGGYLAGFESVFTPSGRDRRWKPHCCTRPHASLIACTEQALWVNELRRDLNLTLQPDQFLVGLLSYFDNIVLDRRWRYRYCQVEVSCGDPGTPPHSSRTGDDFLYGGAVQYTCNHGYYLSAGNLSRECLDTGLWSGTPPTCSVCSEIANCADTRCSSSEDHLCQQCLSHHGPETGRRGFLNLNTSCAPLCSWLGSYCYPGNCSGLVETCQCTEGFAGADCLTMTSPVDALSCAVSVLGAGSAVAAPCTHSSSPTTFINFPPAALSSQWTAVYRGPSPRPHMSAYITGFAVGVVEVFVSVEIARATNPGAVVLRARYNCSSSSSPPSADQPVEMDTCTNTHPLDALEGSIFHGDHLVVKVTALNGGYLGVNDLDAGELFRRHYGGMAAESRAAYVVDLLAPNHCSLLQAVACLVGQPLLDTPTILEAGPLPVAWGGYRDSPSGLQGFTLEVRAMIEVGGVLRELGGGAVYSGQSRNVSEQSLTASIALPSDGPYSVLLGATDAAGNTRLARRLVLYDSNSSLLTDPAHPLTVVNSVGPSLPWVNSTSGPLLVAGRGHFYNTNLRSSNWLAPVEDHRLGTVEPDYDHPLTTGNYPRNGTRNALGVVAMEFAVETVMNGPAGQVQPRSGWIQTADIFLEGVEVEVPRVDGMSVGAWLRAEDFKGNTLVAVAVVHVDSSPPEASELGIEYGDVRGLSLHGSAVFTDLVVHLRAWDPHSGLSSIRWALGTSPGGAEDGAGFVQLELFNQSTCAMPSCNCDNFDHCHSTQHVFSTSENDLLSMATRHDTDYYITVTITNNALLETVLTHRFTVDVTPPLEGVVFDGPAGAGDWDYQLSLDLEFWWAGFYDREVGVAYYKYIVGAQCATASQFRSDQVATTTNTSVMWTAGDVGEYRMSVVAYNSALRPSLVVCSDGLTVDRSPPLVSSLLLPNLRPHPSGNGYFVPLAHYFNLSWVATDNIGIRDYKVAIATSPDLLPWWGDVVPLRSSGGLSFLTVLNASLTTGTTLHLEVWAEDLAGNNASLSLGPVVMDTTPPLLNGTVAVQQLSNHVMVTWDDVEVSDIEEGDVPFVFEYAVGTSPYGGQVLPYALVPAEHSPPCEGGACVAIDNTLLLSNTLYYVTLSVKNLIGLSSHMTESFSYVSGEIPPGVVLETLSSDTYDDVDVAMATDELLIKWRGLHHAHLETHFTVALGTSPFSDDVISPIEVGGASEHVLSNLSLQVGQEYFTTVRAQALTNTSVAAKTGAAVSDGFYYLGNVTSILAQATVEAIKPISPSVVMATWSFPQPLRDLASHYTVAVSTADGKFIVELMTGSSSSAVLAGLDLQTGRDYKLSVVVCLPLSCLPAVYAAFSVDTPPEILALTGLYSLDRSTLHVSWALSNSSVADGYQWALGLDSHGGRLLLPWQPVEAGLTSVEHTPLPLPKGRNWYVTLRAVSPAGTVAMTTLVQYQRDGSVVAREQAGITPPLVMDVMPSSVGTVPNASTWESIEHGSPSLLDVDHSSSADTLAAVWPTLRYRAYSWSVAKQPSFTACSEAVACGETHSNFVIVSNLDLEHNATYYLCVRGLLHDVIEQNVLPVMETALTECTDGVTIVTESPSVGIVSVVGLQDNSCSKGKTLLTSVSEVGVSWSGFTEGFIASYSYAVGTSPGEDNVSPFTSVGASSGHMISGLRLQPGIPHYLTVQAVDLVGHLVSAWSDPVVSDVTPPTVEEVWLESGRSPFITRESPVLVAWTPAVDESSCVSELFVSLGTLPGHSGSGQWVRIQDAMATTANLTLEDFNIRPGDTVYASVRVSNPLGLAAVYSSALGYHYDPSPPFGEGVVYDGVAGPDLDHSPSGTAVSAHWLPWTDPHSPLHYLWAIGTCRGCADIQDFTTVGNSLQASAQGLSLVHGRRYFVSVLACNLGDLCAAPAHSDGFVVDRTPPSVGVVYDGFGHTQVTRQVDRSHIYSSWDGFHDAESGLSHYVFAAGYAPDDTSLVPPILVPPTQTSVVVCLDSPLPALVISTVWAVNRAGLNVSVHSGGVSLDDTPPLLAALSWDVGWGGSARGRSQYSRSVVRLSWTLATPPSNQTTPPSNQTTPTVYWTVVPPPRSALPRPLSPSWDRSGAVGYAALSDGGVYRAMATVCSWHGLCAPPTLGQAVLVDSSPPIDGYFTVATDSESPLPRPPAPPTWTNSGGRGWLTLQWAGFADPHSQLEQLLVSVGSSYNAQDLTGQPQWLGAGPEGAGSVALTRPLVVDATVFVQLWSVNRVGLPSARAPASFLLREDPLSGNRTLQLLRSLACPAHSCLGHCTCAARGGRCLVTPPSPCRDLTPGRAALVSVALALPQPVLWPSNTTYSPRVDKLEGSWNVSDSAPSVLWVEWTVATANEIPDVWYPGDAAAGGASTAVVYTPPRPLVHGRQYRLLVRAWTSASDSSLHHSPPLTVDLEGPRVLAGGRAAEGAPDTDHVATATVSLDWGRVFQPGVPGQELNFDLKVETVPEELVQGVGLGVTAHQLNLPSARPGQFCRSSVTAVNALGFSSTSTSDGFTFDDRPVTVGHLAATVTDGTQLQLEWTGFHGYSAPIQQYEYSLQTSPIEPPQSGFTGVGIARSHSPPTPLPHGVRHWVYVRAVDAIGTHSSPAVAMVTGDSNPPVGVSCDYSDNVVHNPSFEQGSPLSPCTTESGSLDGWNMSSSVAMVSIRDAVPAKGCSSALVSGRGYLVQQVPTLRGRSYRLSLAIKAAPGNRGLTAVSVDIEGAPKRLLLATTSWEYVRLDFDSEGSYTTLAVRPISYHGNGVLVDDVSMATCTVVSTVNGSSESWDAVFASNKRYFPSVQGLSLCWDAERSNLVRQEWSLGSSPGGSQYLSFRGTLSSCVTPPPLLPAPPPGQSLYLTLRLTGGAGLQRVVPSGPLTVDPTPPAFPDGVWEVEADGTGSAPQQDRDWTTRPEVRVRWAVVDSESEVEYCYVGLGSTPGEADLWPFATVQGGGAYHTWNTSGLPDVTYYTTVVCVNGAGLAAMATSDGIRVAAELLVEDSILVLDTPTMDTYYPSQSGVFPTDDIAVLWSGRSSLSPVTHQIQFGSSDWIVVGGLQQLVLFDLGSTSYLDRTVAVQWVWSEGGVASTELTRSFNVSGAAPQLNDSQLLAQWNTSTQSLTIDWSAVFTFTEPLQFEVSLSRVQGGAPVVLWLETELTSLTFTNPHISSSQDYIFTLTAVTLSGHPLTNLFLVHAVA